MTNIIHFIQRKSEKEDARIEQMFQRAHSLDHKLELLLQQKDLQVQDHRLFLAFLTYAKQQNLEPEQIFKDIVQLPKHQFEQHYNMNWAPIVKLTATFLAILQQTSHAQYVAFQQAVNRL